jgi:hypothetical protein
MVVVGRVVCGLYHSLVLLPPSTHYLLLTTFDLLSTLFLVLENLRPPQIRPDKSPKKSPNPGLNSTNDYSSVYYTPVPLPLPLPPRIHQCSTTPTCTPTRTHTLTPTHTPMQTHTLPPSPTRLCSLWRSRWGRSCSASVPPSRLCGRSFCCCCASGSRGACFGGCCAALSAWRSWRRRVGRSWRWWRWWRFSYRRAVFSTTHQGSE